MNDKPVKNTLVKKSKYIGVSLHRTKWYATVNYNKKAVYHYLCETELEASIRRDLYILKHYPKVGFELNHKWSDKEIEKNIKKYKMNEVTIKTKLIKKSHFFGIRKYRKNWQAFICKNNKEIYKHSYTNEETAARARDIYLITHNLTDSYKMNFTWTPDDITLWQTKLNIT